MPNVSANVFEVGAAIQFLSKFPPRSHLACRTAGSICSIMRNSTHLTPDHALKEDLKQSYFRAKQRVTSEGGGPSFLEAWQWVQRGVERKIREWVEVGVTMGNMVELVERARRGGSKFGRSVHFTEGACSVVVPCQEAVLNSHTWTQTNV